MVSFLVISRAFEITTLYYSRCHALHSETIVFSDILLIVSLISPLIRSSDPYYCTCSFTFQSYHPISFDFLIIIFTIKCLNSSLFCHSNYNLCIYKSGHYIIFVHNIKYVFLTIQIYRAQKTLSPFSLSTL